jgi:hypothetical protein
VAGGHTHRGVGCGSRSTADALDRVQRMPADTAPAVRDRLAALPLGGIEGWDELTALLSRGQRLIGGS